MPYSFDYVVIRVVPLVEREEFFNAGVVLFCRQLKFLDARIHLDRAKWKAFAPTADIQELERHLEAIPKICAGEPTAGPVAELQQSARFHWLSAPRSTLIQVSPVHSGLCTEPEAALDRLFAHQVLGATHSGETAGECSS
jgi:hypothetical protein